MGHSQQANLNTMVISSIWDNQVENKSYELIEMGKKGTVTMTQDELKQHKKSVEMNLEILKTLVEQKAEEIKVLAYKLNPDELDEMVSETESELAYLERKSSKLFAELTEYKVVKIKLCAVVQTIETLNSIRIKNRLEASKPITSFTAPAF